MTMEMTELLQSSANEVSVALGMDQDDAGQNWFLECGALDEIHNVAFLVSVFCGSTTYNGPPAHRRVRW